MGLDVCSWFGGSPHISDRWLLGSLVAHRLGSQREADGTMSLGVMTGGDGQPVMSRVELALVRGVPNGCFRWWHSHSRWA